MRFLLLPGWCQLSYGNAWQAPVAKRCDNPAPRGYGPNTRWLDRAGPRAGSGDLPERYWREHRRLGRVGRSRRCQRRGTSRVYPSGPSPHCCSGQPPSPRAGLYLLVKLLAAMLSVSTKAALCPQLPDLAYVTKPPAHGDSPSQDIKTAPRQSSCCVSGWPYLILRLDLGKKFRPILCAHLLPPI